jgi:hypothetical protein
VNTVFDIEVTCLSSDGKDMRKFIFLASECCYRGYDGNCGSRVGILSYPFHLKMEIEPIYETAILCKENQDSGEKPKT